MTKRQAEKQYFDWMYDILCWDEPKSYLKLLNTLHNIDFAYSLPMDANRAEDGVILRYRFGSEAGYEDPEIATYLDDRPCSVLEMMTALALRYEEHIMRDDKYGDRTYLWFWTMLDSLGISDMSDDSFIQEEAEDAIFKMMNREYAPDGTGGLFRIPNCSQDLRQVEIWYQGCWYLSVIVDELGEWM